MNLHQFNRSETSRFNCRLLTGHTSCLAVCRYEASTSSCRLPTGHILCFVVCQCGAALTASRDSGSHPTTRSTTPLCPGARSASPSVCPPALPLLVGLPKRGTGTARMHATTVPRLGALCTQGVEIVPCFHGPDKGPHTRALSKGPSRGEAPCVSIINPVNLCCQSMLNWVRGRRWLPCQCP